MPCRKAESESRHSSCVCSGSVTTMCLLPLACQLATAERSIATDWYHSASELTSSCPASALEHQNVQCHEQTHAIRLFPS